MSSQGSRLAQIQMRYQQKQMHENAQKKSDMFDETQKLLTSSLGAGKVRAMFDERRHRITAGIDKSYLLEPIVVDTKTTTTKRVIAPAKPMRLDQKMSNYSKVIVPPLQNRTTNHDINGNNHFSTNDDPLDRTFRETTITSTTTRIATKTNEKLNSTTTGITRKLTPAAVSSPPPLKNVTNQKASPTRSTRSGNSSTSTASTKSLRSMVSPKVTSSGQSQSRVASSTYSKGRTSAEAAKSENSPQGSFDENDGDDGPVPEGLTRCSICKRNFAEDRIEKHTVICQKAKTKKRKVYDASKKRVQGTEAESFNKKPISAVRAPKATPKSNNNWRTKHEDFIRTIRAAKEMQVHLAKGGKLSDLPPPPPSENPDYVQCPHCNRRFNEGAASRHIPLCKNMQHNKPKAKTSSVAAGKTSNSLIKRR